MNNPPQQPSLSSEAPSLGLDDIHLNFSPVDFSQLGKASPDTTPPPPANAGRPEADVVSRTTDTPFTSESVRLRPGLVYVATSRAEDAADKASKILEKTGQDWADHRIDLRTERLLFLEISKRRVDETGKATRAVEQTKYWVGETAEQLAAAKARERDLVGKKAVTAGDLGTAVSIVEANKRLAEATGLTLDRVQSEVHGLVDKQAEHIAEKQKILDDIEAHKLVKQRHQQRMSELSIERTADGTRIDVLDPADPNGLSDPEREMYQVPDALNYKIQVEIDPRTTLNPRTEIEEVRRYVEGRLLPDIDREIDRLEHDELLRYDDDILPGVALQLRQKVADMHAKAAGVRAAEGRVGSSQIAADAQKHVFELAYDAEKGAQARLGELGDALDELLVRAEQLPVPSDISTAALMIMDKYGRSGQEAVAQLGMEPRQAAIYGSGGQHTEQLAISAGGPPSARSVSLGGLAKRVAEQLKPGKVARAVADRALKREVVKQIETDD